MISTRVKIVIMVNSSARCTTARYVDIMTINFKKDVKSLSFSDAPDQLLSSNVGIGFTASLYYVQYLYIYHINAIIWYRK